MICRDVLIFAMNCSKMFCCKKKIFTQSLFYKDRIVALLNKEIERIFLRMTPLIRAGKSVFSPGFNLRLQFSKNFLKNIKLFSEFPCLSCVRGGETRRNRRSIQWFLRRKRNMTLSEVINLSSVESLSAVGGAPPQERTVIRRFLF